MHACNMFQAMQRTMAATKTLAFKVSRRNPELIPPAEPTPDDLKYFSDNDHQTVLRRHYPMIYLYKGNHSMRGKDPVNTIRDAIAKALVFYYPLAGRVREYSGGRLAVECTGEGVVFIEADADVALEEFGDALYPPFPNLEELLPIQSSDGITDSPLFYFQVTRLKCGGFILAYIFNHTMCDGAGLVQFIDAVAELARGAAAPSILPVWERHLLTAPNPPHSQTETHEAVLSELDTGKVVRSFFISAADISALRRSLPPHLHGCSKFEVLAGCVWRCRAIALSLEPDEEIRFLSPVSVGKLMNPPLPAGYYGNAVIHMAATTTAEKLSKNPLHYAVELVAKAKSEALDEFLRSAAADLNVMLRNQPGFAAAARAYLVSDLTRAGFEQTDFGWGTAAYGGTAKGIHGSPIEVSWYIPFKNKMGESGTVVPVCLPPNAMDVFVKQLQLTTAAARRSSAL